MLKFTRTMIAGGLLLGGLIISGCDREDPVIVTNASPLPVDASPSTRPAPRPPTTANAAAPLRLGDTFIDINGPVEPDKLLAKCIQTISEFNRPFSSAVSLEGKHLFVTNSAASLNGTLYYKGAISKLELLEDGRLKMVKREFIPALHSPMGIDVLPKATKRFPAGALFVSTGATSGCDDKGDRISDIKKFNTGVSIFDPDSGKLLGFIPMAAGRAVAKSLFHPVMAPAGLIFDAEGNLYVADAGNTGKELEPEVIGRPGILRIKHAQIDGYSEDKDAGDVSFLGVYHVPMSIYFSRLDNPNCIYWTTSDGVGPEGGAVYRMISNAFPQPGMRQVILGDQGGPLMGITITPRGVLLASRLDGDLAFITPGVVDKMRFNEDASFSSPAEIKLRQIKPGYTVVYVPEQEPNAVRQWEQRLRVILIPSRM